MLVVDAANVIGSRPTGWWRDRPAAAREFVERTRAAAREGRIAGPVVVVVEGAARGGVEAATLEGVRVVHASGSGDDAIVEVIDGAEGEVTLVSADRGLRARAVALGAEVRGPGWLIGLMGR